MLRPSISLTDIYLCLEPVDFRKGIRTLSILVESVLCHKSMTGQLFVFRNRQRDKVKMVSDIVNCWGSGTWGNLLRITKSFMASYPHKL